MTHLQQETAGTAQLLCSNVALGSQVAGQHGQLHDCCWRQHWSGSWYSWVGQPSDAAWLCSNNNFYHKQMVRHILRRLSDVSLRLLALTTYDAGGGFKRFLCEQVTKEGQEAEQIRSSVAQEEAKAGLQRAETANLKGGLLLPMWWHSPSVSWDFWFELSLILPNVLMFPSAKLMHSSSLTALTIGIEMLHRRLLGQPD